MMTRMRLFVRFVRCFFSQTYGRRNAAAIAAFIATAPSEGGKLLYERRPLFFFFSPLTFILFTSSAPLCIFESYRAL